MVNGNVLTLAKGEVSKEIFFLDFQEKNEVFLSDTIDMTQETVLGPLWSESIPDLLHFPLPAASSPSFPQKS